ncbi:MAG: methylated-DNA--[protein]-cysteine S-methyltransferase [Prolixibacteraceae bacterium]
MKTLPSNNQNIITFQYYKTDFGELILGSFKNQLCLVDWRYRKMRTAIDSRIQTALNADFKEGSTQIIDETKNQLNQYFQQNRKEFTVPLLFVGTDFQKSVWEALQQIPFGSTMTYLALSKKLANEKAVRAVASANGANAISIIVPCHRIIGSDGNLVGYAGGLSTKKKLLALEGAVSVAQLNLF